MHTQVYFSAPSLKCIWWDRTDFFSPSSQNELKHKSLSSSYGVEGNNGIIVPLILKPFPLSSGILKILHMQINYGEYQGKTLRVQQRQKGLILEKAQYETLSGRFIFREMVLNMLQQSGYFRCILGAQNAEILISILNEKYKNHMMLYQ